LYASCFHSTPGRSSVNDPQPPFLPVPEGRGFRAVERVNRAVRSIQVEVPDDVHARLEALARRNEWDVEMAVVAAVAAGLACLEVESAGEGKPSEAGDFKLKWAESQAAYAALKYKYYEALQNLKVADMHLAGMRAENENLRLLAERLRAGAAEAER